MVKNRLFKLANCAGVKVKSPVARSVVAPVAAVYFASASGRGRRHVSKPPQAC